MWTGEIAKRTIGVVVGFLLYFGVGSLMLALTLQLVSSDTLIAWFPVSGILLLVGFYFALTGVARGVERIPLLRRFVDWLNPDGTR